LAAHNCPDCTAKASGAETIDVDGHPFAVCGILYGTPKEIAWAVTIRRRVIGALLKYRRPGENPLVGMEKFVDAKWWIKHRDDKFGDLARELKQAA